MIVMLITPKIVLRLKILYQGKRINTLLHSNSIGKNGYLILKFRLVPVFKKYYVSLWCQVGLFSFSCKTEKIPDKPKLKLTESGL